MEQAMGNKVSSIERQYQYTDSAVSRAPVQKTSATPVAPAAMSPICLAKPMISMA
jgi:hypothetical protein